MEHLAELLSTKGKFTENIYEDRELAFRQIKDDRLAFKQLLTIFSSEEKLKVYCLEQGYLQPFLEDSRLTIAGASYGGLGDVYKLHEIPDEIGQLTHLKRLILRNHRIKILPQALKRLHRLEELDLAQNQLGQTKNSLAVLADLHRLTALNLSNQLIIYPEAIFQLSNLKRLFLKHVQLKHMGRGLANLKNLTVLSLAGNPLSTVPLSGLVNLKELNLSKTSIGLTHFAELCNSLASLPNLEILNVKAIRSYHELGIPVALPPAIGLLSRLKELVLSVNYWSSLPPEIGLLRQLEKLDLFDTGITHFPDEISQLTQLKVLYWRPAITKSNGRRYKLEKPPQTIEKLKVLLPNTRLVID